MRIRSFRNEKKKQYYFRVFDANEEQVLRSEAYEAKAGRDNGIESLKNNAPTPERYERLTSSDGKFYFNVKAANHQVIATSLMFDSEEKRESVIAEIIAYATSARGGDSTAPDPQNLSSSPNPNSDDSGNDGGKEQDDYHDLSFYENSGTDTESGFDRFQKGDDNYYYFSFKSDDGKVLLFSQGYTAEAGRDNGIASVEKNGKIEKRYTDHTTDDGKFFFTLKAGNHQEVARSCNFDTEDEMKRAMIIILIGGGAMVEVVKAIPKSSEVDMDDYRTFGFYKASGTDVQNGWDRFYSEKHREFYFSYKVDGDPILISEGYKTEAARENGIASVEKNWILDKRYKNHETSSGRYYYTIIAGNHQEIARSKWYSSAEERDGGVSWLLASGIAGATATNLAASVSTGDEMVEKSIKSSTKNKVQVEDDYLPCKEYEGHEVNDKVNNVAFFKHENGQFYFVIYKEDGTVRLRSEGFENAKTRDVELSGVLKNLDNPEMYETVSRGKYSIHILNDAEGREIGRSCLETIEEKAAVIPSVVEATAIAAAIISAIDSAPKPVIEVEPDKEDDYLLCTEYENRKISDKKNKVGLFKHSDGQYYFVIYKSDGTVRLRSEGFRTPRERDSELSGALRNLENADMYETVTRGEYSMHILRDESGREVGRSCLETESDPLAIPILVAATSTGIGAMIPEVVPPIVVEEEIITPVPPPVVTEKVIPPPITTASAAESGGGGFNWKLLLLLIPLLAFLFWKGCNCSGNNGTPPTPVKVDPTPKPMPVDTLEKVDTLGKIDTLEKEIVPTPEPKKKKVPTPDPVSCNCTGSSNIIFNIPTNQAPKVLTRFGRTPEFGKSHRLDPPGFYNNLNTAPATNNRDKRFLDDLFEAMGYPIGFAGANAGLFSNVRIPKGTNGNMGQGKKHRTNYAKLNVSGKDLDAFKIKAANGCDIHFMKTCGNHFFFCPK
jgi:uncharacterized protein YegP (UPF0339 family)